MAFIVASGEMTEIPEWFPVSFEFCSPRAPDSSRAVENNFQSPQLTLYHLTYSCQLVKTLMLTYVLLYSFLYCSKSRPKSALKNRLP